MAYGDFKDLLRRTASDKVLCGIAFNIAKNPKHDGCKRGLTLMVIFFLVEGLLINTFEQELILRTSIPRT